jgi:hypothetical protein
MYDFSDCVLASPVWPVSLQLIPKVGCSYLREWWYRMHGCNPKGTRRDDAIRDYGVGNLSLEGKCRRLENDDTIAFVRNPYERLVSAFLNRAIAVGGYRYAARAIANCQRLRRDKIDIRAGITFAEFVDTLERTDPETWDIHWRPQAHFLHGVKWKSLHPINRMTDVCIAVAERYDVSEDVVPPDPINALAYDMDYHGRFAARIPSSELLSMERKPPPNHFFDGALRKAVGNLYAEDLALWKKVASR